MHTPAILEFAALHSTATTSSSSLDSFSHKVVTSEFILLCKPESSTVWGNPTSVLGGGNPNNCILAAATEFSSNGVSSLDDTLSSLSVPWGFWEGEASVLRSVRSFWLCGTMTLELSTSAHSSNLCWGSHSCPVVLSFSVEVPLGEGWPPLLSSLPMAATLVAESCAEWRWVVAFSSAFSSVFSSAFSSAFSLSESGNNWKEPSSEELGDAAGLWGSLPEWLGCRPSPSSLCPPSATLLLLLLPLLPPWSWLSEGSIDMSIHCANIRDIRLMRLPPSGADCVSGRASGPVSDQSPRRRIFFAGGGFSMVLVYWATPPGCDTTDEPMGFGFTSLSLRLLLLTPGYHSHCEM